MRILIKMNDSLAAYETNCVEYTDDVGVSNLTGLYIEAMDRDPDEEYILVSMCKEEAYKCIREISAKGYIDLSQYNAFSIDTNTDEIIDVDSNAIVDEYMRKYNFDTQDSREEELDRLLTVMDTDDIDELAKYLIKYLM